MRQVLDVGCNFTFLLVEFPKCIFNSLVCLIHYEQPLNCVKISSEKGTRNKEQTLTSWFILFFPYTLNPQKSLFKRTDKPSLVFPGIRLLLLSMEPKKIIFIN